MNHVHLFVGGWAITVGVITFYDFKNCHDLPWPPRFIAAAVVFTLLDLFSMVSEELAGVIAIGIVIAALVNKGFSNSDCSHAEATQQPISYQGLQQNPAIGAGIGGGIGAAGQQGGQVA